jgi:hypothetical protein
MADAENSRPNLRKVACDACGKIEPLVMDRPGVAVELPRGWKRFGVNPVRLACAECYRNAMEAARHG